MVAMEIYFKFLEVIVTSLHLSLSLFMLPLNKAYQNPFIY